MLSTDTLIATIEALGLLGESERTHLAELARRAGADPVSLARVLLARGWLTPFQINRLFNGKAESLVIDSYQLLDRLGEGGMGQVFLARHRRLGRLVALKIIRRDQARNAEALRRFRREVLAAAQLSHPNIVHAYDAGECGDTVFLVMEYVNGVTLKDLVLRSGPLPVSLAGDLIRQAALGLEHAYRRNLTHRDVKPANLLVTGLDSLPIPPRGHRRAAPIPLLTSGPAPVLKILDLGLARLLSAGTGVGDSATLTQTNLLIGTPDYLSPEQAADPHRADIRSDLYSLGCTYYYLLTASVPFPGGTSLEKLFRHHAEMPRPVTELRPEIPPPVARIVARLLAKKPEDRFQTPRELAEAIELLTRPETDCGETVPEITSRRTKVEAPTLPPGAEAKPPNWVYNGKMKSIYRAVLGGVR